MELRRLRKSSGTYTLMLVVRRPIEVKVGKLGPVRFPSGVYAYNGSALGRGIFSLGGRIKGHFRTRSRPHYHVDFLLAQKPVKVPWAIVAETTEKKECEISRFLEKLPSAQVIIKGLGSSDCKSCKAHLYYFLDSDLQGATELVLNAYKFVGLKPRMLSLSKRT